MISKNEIMSKIDYSILRPEASEKDLEIAIQIAKANNVASICVKPNMVSTAKRLLEDSNIRLGTVISFPHGNSDLLTKQKEICLAYGAGAQEIDVVPNIANLINYSADSEIRNLVNYARQFGLTFKLIIETSLLTEDQIYCASQIAQSCGVDYIKTSTGFGSRGATLNDIKFIKQGASNTCIKASGGIKTLQQCIDFIEAGCLRIGTSNVEQIAEEYDKKSQEEELQKYIDSMIIEEAPKINKPEITLNKGNQNNKKNRR